MSSSKSPKIRAPEQIEEVDVIKEDEADAVRREKRRQILSSGKKSTVLSGIATALKERLGK